MDREILRLGVRWIELAAASPILNCIVTYYVEGDRGHLMDEFFLTWLGNRVSIAQLSAREVIESKNRSQSDFSYNFRLER